MCLPGVSGRVLPLSCRENLQDPEGAGGETSPTTGAAESQWGAARQQGDQDA